MCGSLFFGRIITILFPGVCTLFLTISAIVPSRGSTFFSQDVYYIAHKRLTLSSLNAVADSGGGPWVPSPPPFLASYV